MPHYFPLSDGKQAIVEYLSAFERPRSLLLTFCVLCVSF
jgi:hypothetical protein